MKILLFLAVVLSPIMTAWCMQEMRLPQLDIDNINWEDFQNIIENYGTFELVGKSMASLAPYAQRGLDLTRDILNLDIEVLIPTIAPKGQNRFNGFQNVRAVTNGRVSF